MNSKDNLSSLKRGLKALALMNARDAMTASELARELRTARTTARRVLDTLLEEGYVSKSGAEFKYRITPMVNLLASGFSNESWITHAASPLLTRKTLETGWPLAIATPSGEDMVCQYSTDRLTPLAVDHFSIGFRTPMLHGTSGHAMLAFMEPAHQEQMIKLLRNSPDPRQALARDEARLRALLRSVRSQGFAHVIYREYPEASISVPILMNGLVRACLIMVYAKLALKPQEVRTIYSTMLKGLASEISNAASAHARVTRRSRAP